MLGLFCLPGPPVFGRAHSSEDPIRFLKQGFQLEKGLLRTLRALAFLVAIAMSLLTGLLGAGPLARALVRGIEWYAYPVMAGAPCPLGCRHAPE